MPSILGFRSRLLGLRSRLLHYRRGGRELLCTAAHRELARPPSPCLMLPPCFIGGGGGDMVYNFYSPIKGGVVSFNNKGGKEETQLIQDEETVLVGSSDGWLVLFNGVNRDICLLNPLSGRRISLPPLPGKNYSFAPWKVILSSSPDDDDDDCHAIMIIGYKTRPAICRPGRNNEWTPLDDWYPDRRCYLDFVYSAARKRLYGLVQSDLSILSIKEELEGWDINNSNSNSTSTTRRFDLCQLMKKTTITSKKRITHLKARYLVHDEQSDQLFLVERYVNFRDVDGDPLQIMHLFDSQVKHFVDREKIDPEKVDNKQIIDPETVDYDVYRIDDGGGLELCWSLDDLVMFVGINHSLAVKASRFPQLKPNSIYFSDTRFPFFDDHKVLQTVEVFDYGNKTRSPVYYTSRHQKYSVPLPWFTPTLD